MPHEPLARETVAAALDAACAELPRGWVPAESFAAFLGERFDDAARVAAAPLADLYLACAALRGNAEAITAFERVHGPGIESALRRLELPPDRVDELRGLLRTKLLVGAEPLLARYRGAGALGAWLRVVATREGLSALRRDTDAPPPPDEERLASLEEDLELTFVKASCRDAFKVAFADAIASLPVRERTLLKQHYLDGLSAREIARMRRVHHGTVARWLEEVREAVLKRTRAALHERLASEGTELESIVRMLQSRWDVTVGGFLGGSSR